MVPNRFPDVGEQPDYNMIDASLWFVHAIDRYLVASQDEARVRETAWPQDHTHAISSPSPATKVRLTEAFHAKHE
jgi:glycogen debranching enzyme